MPREGYKSVAIKESDFKQFQEYYKEHKEMLRKQGITTFAGFVTMVLYEGFDEKNWLTESRQLTHFNVYEDHVTLFDKKLDHLVDVYFRNGKVFCTFDEAEDCDHVRFVFTIPKVVDMLTERGWRIVEGKVLKRPS